VKATLNVIFFLSLLCSGKTLAQWSTDPTNPLIVGYGLLSEVCSDSVGSCYITYQQGTSYPTDIGLTRLNRYGYQAWGGAKRIQGLLPEQYNSKIIEDGNNGVIVSYLNEFDTNTSYTYRVRVQRVDSSGDLLWGATG